MSTLIACMTITNLQSLGSKGFFKQVRFMMTSTVVMRDQFDHVGWNLLLSD